MKVRKIPAMAGGHGASFATAQDKQDKQDAQEQESETAVDVVSPGALNQLYVNDIREALLLTADQEFRIWATLRARDMLVGADPSTACNYAQRRLGAAWDAFTQVCDAQGVTPLEHERVFAEAQEMPTQITSTDASPVCAWLRAHGWGQDEMAQPLGASLCEALVCSIAAPASPQVEPASHVEVIRIWAAHANELLVTSNLRLVMSVCRPYRDLGFSHMDLVQEGNIGLIRAVEKFDASLGNRFSTYATWWIKQCILRSLSKQSRALSVPANIAAAASRLRRLQMRHLQLTGQQATDEQLVIGLQLLDAADDAHIRSARASGAPLPAALTRKLDRALRQVRKIKLALAMDVSFDGSDGEDDEAPTLADTLANPDAPAVSEAVESEALNAQMRASLSVLDAREREVLELRYGLHEKRYTLEEVAARFRITRERVRQIESQALRKLRHPSLANRLRDHLDD
jgi:RNA polymerase sigma factor (sigma-70 family)